VIPERLGGVFTTRRYTNPRLPLPLPLPYLILAAQATMRRNEIDDTDSDDLHMTVATNSKQRRLKCQRIEKVNQEVDYKDIDGALTAMTTKHISSV